VKTIYIASPYTLGDVAQNVKVQIDAADEIMNLGFCPFVPLLTHFQHVYKPRPYEDWMDIGKEMVRRCDILLRLPGKSKGADKEVKLALSLKKPVIYSIDELKDYANT
jgi:Domain of unknown function (DUF4406)